MNRDDFLDAKDDGIGIDPTMMPTIDSLDASPSEIKKNIKASSDLKKPNNASNVIKKILFTIVVLLCMAGVSFGVYYYLSLGTKAKKNAPVLENKTIFMGDSLSSSIMEYGDFSKIDISKCTLDVLGVNVNEVGEYDYSVTCNEVKYSAKIYVKEKVIFNVATKLIYVDSTDELKPEDFVSIDGDDYTVSYANSNQGFNDFGLQSVGIRITDSNDKEMVVYGLVYVVSSTPSMYLTCTSPDEIVNGNTLNKIDRFAVNENDEDMDLTIRKFKYTFTDDKSFEMTLFSIKDGMTTIEGNSGYALVNIDNKTIELISAVSRDDIEQEIGETLGTGYRDIGTYYRGTLKYSCSI